jgi:hypothetical protein
MARNSVTPVAPIERISNPKIGQRRSTHFTQLEEWRIYSQLLADERRQQEQVIMPNQTEQA